MSHMIYTVGHSTHALPGFLDIIRPHGIDVIVDVRSTPFSRIAPDFNRGTVDAALSEAGIRYLPMAREFGARRPERILYNSEGKVDFQRLRSSLPFQQGVMRLKNGVAAGHRIALMCAEGNPVECHRFSLISYHLIGEGVAVGHILPDGTIADQAELEQQLFHRYAAHFQDDIFRPGGAQSGRERLYRLLESNVAYSEQRG